MKGARAGIVMPLRVVLLCRLVGPVVDVLEHETETAGVFCLGAGHSFVLY